MTLIGFITYVALSLNGYDIYKNQLGIELCKPKQVGDYLILGTDKLNKIESTMQRRGITKEQYAVAPVDIFESDYLHNVR